MPSVVAKLDAQRALARIIRNEVTKKSRGDGALNPSEQKTLSPFLREVAVDIRPTPWSKVEAEALIDQAMGRAMKTWAKVNDKGPSRLSDKELAKLKSQDPALAKLTGKAVKAALAAKSKPEAGAPVELKSLPASTKLAELIDEKGTEWLDNNITNGGSTRIFGHRLKLDGPLTAAQLEDLARRMFGDRAKSEEIEPASGTTIETSTGKMNKKAVVDTAAFAMLGYDYSPQNTESLKELELDVKRVTSLVGPSAQLLWASAGGTMKSGMFEDTEQKARLTVFADKKTGQLAAFWVLQGFM